MKTSNCIIIPRGRDYDEPLIEAANNMPAEDLSRVNDFLRQGIRALISRNVSRIHPDEKGEQTLRTDINLTMRTKVTAIIQTSDGCIDFIINRTEERHDFDTVDTDNLLTIANNLEYHRNVRKKYHFFP